MTKLRKAGVWRRFLMLCTVGVLCVAVFSGCQTQKQTGEPVLLVNYYCATAAAADGGDSLEYALYEAQQPDRVWLHVYVGQGEEETCTRYLVPRSALEEALAVIRGGDFASWNESDGIALDGARTVCRFRTENGDYIRVSTDHMPENGKEQLDAVGNTLAAYICEQYLFEEQTVRRREK